MSPTTTEADPGSGVPQVPRVGGVAGGVGTTTVAALLQGTDAGTATAQSTTPVHVLVCRSTASSVQAAVVLAACMPLTPVLAVVADCGDRPPATVRHRLHMAEPNLAAIAGAVVALAARGRRPSRAGGGPGVGGCLPESH